MLFTIGKRRKRESMAERRRDRGDDEAKAARWDIEGREFDEKEYVRHEYEDTTYDEFMQDVLADIGAQMQETEDHCRMLVQDNLDVFIKSKDSMDMIYTRDKELFTGKALDKLNAAYDSVKTDCEELVEPVFEFSKQLKDIAVVRGVVTKLYNVLSVPGVIYGSCGVKVVSVRDDGDMEGSQATESSSGSDEDDEEEEEEDDETASLPSGGQKEKKKSVHRHRSGNCFDWFGVELERTRNPQSSATDPASRVAGTAQSSMAARADYDAGAQAFRRALLYFEAHFNILDGTYKDIRSVGAPGISAADDAPLHGELAQEQQAGVSAVQNTPFTLQLSLAVLRAALYLLRELKSSVEKTSPGDTIILDDYLGNMMEISIGVVKLRHFCIVMKKALAAKSVTLAAMSQLRGALYDDTAGKGGDEDDGTASVASGATPSNMSLRGGGGGSAAGDRFDTASRTSSKQPPGQEHQDKSGIPSGKQHPVECYLRALRHQHSTAILTAARVATKAAEDLLHKRPSATAGKGSAGTSKVGEGEGSLVFGSIGGSIGRANDTFTLATAGSAVSQSKAKKDAADSTGLLSTVRATVGGGGEAAALSLEPSMRTSSIGAAGDDEASIGARNRRAVLQQFVNSMGASYVTVMAPSDADSSQFTGAAPASYSTQVSYFLADTLDMTLVLSSSTTSLVSHAMQIVTRLQQGLDEPETIMKSAGIFSTPASDFFSAVLAETEYFLGAYWTGIGAAVHSGAFDFQPEPASVLADCLDHAMKESAEDEEDATKASPASKPRSTDANGVKTAAILETGEPRERIPPIFIVPLLTAAADDPLFATTSTPKRGASSSHGPAIRLRTLSFRALRRLIKSAADILVLHVASVANHAISEGFIDRVCGCTPLPQSIDAELFTAVLVEVTLTHLQSMVQALISSVLRSKITVCSTSTSETVGTADEADEISRVMNDLEELRSRVVSVFFSATEIICRAYFTALALSDPTSGSSCNSSSTASSVGSFGFARQDAKRASQFTKSRLFPRLSRQLVSTEIPVKIFNIVALVVDRSLCIVDRVDEVLNAPTLFAPQTAAAAADADPVESKSSDKKSSKKRKPIIVSSAANVLADPATLHIASGNAQVVSSQLQQHEQCVLILLRGILVAAVDAIQLRSNKQLDLSDTKDDTGSMSEEGAKLITTSRTSQIVECLADLVCIRQILGQLISEYILSPSLFSVTARVALPEGSTASDFVRYAASKTQEFDSTVLRELGEVCSCQLDALLCRFVAFYARDVSRHVRQQGIMVPRFDWQRIQEPAEARQFLVDALVTVASAHESLAAMAQPTLAAAAVQQLAAHLALAFVSSIFCDTTSFDTYEASDAFYGYGLLLLEVEGLVIHHTIERLASASSILTGGIATTSGGGKRSKSASSSVDLSAMSASSSPLVAAVVQSTSQMIAADKILMSLVQELNARGVMFCEQCEKDTRRALTATSVRMTVHERKAKREELLRKSLDHSRYIIEAIGTLVESSSLAALAESTSGAPASGSGGNAAAGGLSIAEKLASRTSAIGRAASRAAAPRARQPSALTLEEPPSSASGASGVRRKVTVSDPAPEDAGATTPPPEPESQVVTTTRRRRLAAMQTAISTGNPAQSAPPTEVAISAPSGTTGTAPLPTATRRRRLPAANADPATVTATQQHADPTEGASRFKRKAVK